MAKSTVEKKVTIPTVLSFDRKLSPSAGYFYGTKWSNRINKDPIMITEIATRGVDSTRPKGALNSSAFDANYKKPNLQTADACFLSDDQDTVILTFTLKVVSGLATPSNCNDSDFAISYSQMVEKYSEEFGFKELARRYAQNIASGRALFRNRTLAEKIEVKVQISDREQFTFDGSKYPLHDFSQHFEELKPLADAIELALKGDVNNLLLTVDTYAYIGLQQPVYPSQEMMQKKKNDNVKTDVYPKTKVLYSVNGVAGLHYQKIGNAIRTIDTWYPEYESKKIALPIEVFGTVTHTSSVHRHPSTKCDFYTLFDKLATGEDLKNESDKHYVIACLIRGGVFGGTSED